MNLLKNKGIIILYNWYLNEKNEVKFYHFYIRKNVWSFSKSIVVGNLWNVSDVDMELFIVSRLDWIWSPQRTWQILKRIFHSTSTRSHFSLSVFVCRFYRRRISMKINYCSILIYAKSNTTAFSPLYIYQENCIKNNLST